VAGSTKAATPTTGTGESSDTDLLPGDSEWEDFTSDDGENIEWAKVTDFQGMFRALEERSVEKGNDTAWRLIFDGADGKRCSGWAGYSLLASFRNIAPDSWVRITPAGEKHVGQPSPMRLWRVQVRKGGAPAGWAPVRPTEVVGADETPF
jgi:hypothetical protein